LSYYYYRNHSCAMCDGFSCMVVIDV
jgi:hypothetical protein